MTAPRLEFKIRCCCLGSKQKKKEEKNKAPQNAVAVDECLESCLLLCRASPALSLGPGWRRTLDVIAEAREMMMGDDDATVESQPGPAW